ncbi:uncharacterized protein LOC107040210 [Diachasma alloeum]|uniref:uncharacterized protein LOC107040210 n=1 Tax=Diachasma alloeum TaxID=454923 RepID=UPI00073840F5|nr:uncharacterized protein LOC107040210 [Diachasma alloeum]
MKEIVAPQQSNHSLTNHFATNNGNPSGNSVTNGNNQRRYAVLSTEWISTIGEELGMHPLPDSVLKRLAEDASYRLREVLHKCVTRLRHSKRRRLTSTDVNSVITNLCDGDPVLGVPDQMPSYHSEAKVFVPHENFIDLTSKSINPISLSQPGAPYLQETEICDAKLTETRHSYAKRALKTIFNGSQKTFQVLLNDCSTNAQLGGEGIIDTLISTARSTVISNNAQYTRVTTRTCQLIIAIACNSEAVYPYHLSSVEKLTELLLELLLGSSFINPHVESLFKTCALKLMLRWPSVADKFTPMLEDVFVKEERGSAATDKKRLTAMELLAGVQPLTFFQQAPGGLLSLDNVVKCAPSGSALWEQLALSVCAFMKSRQQGLDLSPLIDHFGDSILPYFNKQQNRTEENQENRSPVVLPIIVRSKIKYANIRQSLKSIGDRQVTFPDSILRGPRREIRFAFAGGRPVPPNNLRRVSLRASYQILRSDMRATTALVACRRLLILKDKKKNFRGSYNLANIHL